jgi:hypothetical protein
MRTRDLLPLCAAALLAVTGGSLPTAAAEPLVIASQGGRPFGGMVKETPGTGTIHCDHGYVEWQVPPDSRLPPLLMVRASSTKTWQTTFDGREGFQGIFLRRGFPVYLTDLPQTGTGGPGLRAHRLRAPAQQRPGLVHEWRLGLWLPGEAKPTFYPGVQFPPDDRRPSMSSSASSTPSSTRRRTSRSRPTPWPRC